MCVEHGESCFVVLGASENPKHYQGDVYRDVAGLLDTLAGGCSETDAPPPKVTRTMPPQAFRVPLP
jgi:hypothetical protein